MQYNLSRPEFNLSYWDLVNLVKVYNKLRSMFIFLSIAGNEGSRFPFINVNISVDIIISWKNYSRLIKLTVDLDAPFWWKCQPSISQFWSKHNCPKAGDIRLFITGDSEGFSYEEVNWVLQSLPTFGLRH